MQPFVTLSGPAAVLARDNVDTDVIVRIERLTSLARGELGPYAFESWRLRGDGSEQPDFVLNQPLFRHACILVAGRNFGCGSSREGAVWALLARGIRCVIAESFGDIFFSNCFQNGVLPIRLERLQVQRVADSARDGSAITVDLQACVIRLPEAGEIGFEVDPVRRDALLEGLDDIRATLKREPAITAWQKQDRLARPWPGNDAVGLTQMPSFIPEQIEVRCAIIRGGTSKGVYFDARDLPPPGPRRDALLMAVMGSEDLMQIDGLGGGRLVTAKLAIVAPSTRADADVDYTYGIVPMGRGRVVYTSNCGNISAGVGPFAIDGGLLVPSEADRCAGVRAVRIHNTNTGKSLSAHVPLAADGRAAVGGRYAIPGVPGTGAEILMDYRATIGAKTGRGMPTGHATDTLVTTDGRAFEVSLCDVGNPCVFIAASALGLQGSELPLEIDANVGLLALLQEIRGRAAALLGFCADWTRAEADSPALPLMVLVAPPADCATADGRALAAAEMDLRARLVFYNRCHESMAGTGAMCTAAAACVPGTVVQQATRLAVAGHLRIGHPLGAMRVVVQPRGGRPDGQLHAEAPLAFERLGFSRTARRLMDGAVCVPNPAFHAPQSSARPE